MPEGNSTTTSGGWLGGLQDTLGFSIGDVFDIYKGINQSKIDLSYGDSQNQINEWNAQASLLSMQNQAAQYAAGANSYLPSVATDKTMKYLGIGLILVGVSGAIYLASK